MLLKKLGQTDVEISAIGQGTGIHHSLTKRKVYQQLESTIRAGIDMGINLIDTAPVYGAGESEVVIGKALKGIRHRVVLATKVSPENLSAKGINKSVEGSLGRLQTDYIDLLQIHWPNPQIPISDTLVGLEEMVQKGLVRNVGICNFSFKDTQEIHHQLTSKLLASVQVEYNLFDRSIEREFLPYGQQEGISIIAYSPLHRGRIVANRKQYAVLQEIANKYHKTPAQIALRWLTGHLPVVVIPNTTNSQRMKENAESMDFDLTDEDVGHLEGKCTGHFLEIPPRSIQVADDSGRSVYRTLEDALENAMNCVPSPQELAQQITAGDFLKPVRLRPASSSHDRFELLEGRIRYWAWVIANGIEKPLPALVEDFS
ncbi:aldo/keto reductase [Candidatus Nitrospira allomarina]|uniref:Aldo/keto reductase n=1 Tax=Candidatus Nitrospira allomarina TaxID=3020900 RepID=A0AA96G7H6_9BACT|nr:aldo/keto reductase [Candidatus Nitrospira allomarina]WNM56829.1 aldo/keto reductase [Candidatus Nitrospira allomarina]